MTEYPHVPIREYISQRVHFALAVCSLTWVYLWIVHEKKRCNLQYPKGSFSLFEVSPALILLLFPMTFSYAKPSVVGILHILRFYRNTCHLRFDHSDVWWWVVIHILNIHPVKRQHFGLWLLQQKHQLANAASYRSLAPTSNRKAIIHHLLHGGFLFFIAVAQEINQILKWNVSRWNQGGKNRATSWHISKSCGNDDFKQNTLQKTHKKVCSKTRRSQHHKRYWRYWFTLLTLERKLILGGFRLSVPVLGHYLEKSPHGALYGGKLLSQLHGLLRVVNKDMLLSTTKKEHIEKHRTFHANPRGNVIESWQSSAIRQSIMTNLS